MKRIALTGGIGTGKTYVLHEFRRHGIPTLDADQISSAVVDVSQPCYQQLRKRFDDDYFLPNDQLDRSALAKLVFENQNARADLEAIVHPAVRRLVDEWFTRCHDSGVSLLAIAEIPLLYETGRAEAFDDVVVVACESSTQVSRIMNRDNLSKEDAHNRLAAQLPIADKVAAASCVIRTDKSYADTALQVMRFLLPFHASQ